MKRALSTLGRAIRRRPGLTWVLTATAIVVVSAIAEASPSVRVVPVLIFVLTVPGFLILDLRTPGDRTAKVAMGIAASVSFYIVLVSISLLADPVWLVPAGVVFACAAVMALLHRRKAHVALERGQDVHATDRRDPGTRRRRMRNLWERWTRGVPTTDLGD